MPFVTSPGSACGIATAGELVWVCGGPYPASHLTYAPDGLLRGETGPAFGTLDVAWSGDVRRMFHLRWASPGDVVAEDVAVDGTLGSPEDSPYHGEFQFRPPLRTGPGGAVLTGDGLLFDPFTLEHVQTLANSIDDAVWSGSTLLTIRRLLPVREWWEPEEPAWGVTEVQAWGADGYPLLWRSRLPGLPRRIFVDGATPIVITSTAGVPRFIPLSCGDGIIQPHERCDGTALAGQSCSSLGLGTGTLACSPGCEWDTSGCAAAAVCGNGVVDRPSEACDGHDVGPVTCQQIGFPAGTLHCSADCASYDTATCSTCGNGVIDPDQNEECDGANVGSASCRMLGYPGGTLGCNADCTFDETTCQRDCALRPCEPDGDVCTVDTCSFDAGCSYQPVDGCTALAGYTITKATATIRRGGVTAHCSARCGDTIAFPLGLGTDGTYRIPSPQPATCPGSTTMIPDEIGTVEPGKNDRENLVPSNLHEVLAAAASCGGFSISRARDRSWIRRSGDVIVEARSVLKTVERRGKHTFNVRRSAWVATIGQAVDEPRGFGKLSSCAEGLRLRCR
jgi:hypothetical protein